jgi:hypothetical protein
MFTDEMITGYPSLEFVCSARSEGFASHPSAKNAEEWGTLLVGCFRQEG